MKDDLVETFACMATEQRGRQNSNQTRSGKETWQMERKFRNGEGEVDKKRVRRKQMKRKLSMVVRTALIISNINQRNSAQHGTFDLWAKPWHLPPQNLLHKHTIIEVSVLIALLWISM